MLKSVDSAAMPTYKIHENTRIIYEEVFKKNDSLVSITIPDSVIQIGSSAFDDCDRLVAVTLGANIERIGAYTFNGCSIENATVPANLIWILQAQDVQTLTIKGGNEITADNFGEFSEWWSKLTTINISDTIYSSQKRLSQAYN